ncbi:MAG: threonyl-tRNA synthetase [Parcubacteria group bacterium Gr01-1014_106]|nr:MAG: threonyl-tRNA synthetase [Parcubacteria group bacterium Gr01-1014_106]
MPPTKRPLGEKKTPAVPEPAELSPRDHPTSPSGLRGAGPTSPSGLPTSLFELRGTSRGAGRRQPQKDEGETLSPRDHRRLGAELDLFIIDPMVGSGLPLWLPKGATIRRELERFIIEEELRAGYLHVITPHLGKAELYETSGHLPYYKDTMFPLMKVEGEEFVLKPMNCPHHIRIFQSRPRSYRDLPMRIAEFGTMYRFEKSGQLMGLTRVRGMTLNDAHIFCREDQIEAEIVKTLELIRRVYQTLGLTDYWVDLALHDPKNKKKYADNIALWEQSEAALRSALQHAGVKFTEAVGDAAFYGPKADIQMKDVAGHTFTVSTIQLDMLLPERFGIEVTNEEGKAERPVIVHRGVIGTHERFIAFLIEHFNGLFPLWLAPIQVRVLPVSQSAVAYATRVADALRDGGLRAELDESNETLPKKIRSAEVQKIPVMIVVGEKEQQGNTVTLRAHGGKNLGVKSLADALAFLRERVAQKSLTLG